MKITVKHINVFDSNLMKELLKRMGESEIDPNPLFFEDPKNILLVGYFDDQLAGYLWAHLLYKPDEKGCEMFLYSIDVSKEYQRRGVGSALIEELKMISKQKGCKEMWVLTNQKNSAAMRLYEKNGGEVDQWDDVMYTFYL